MRRVSRGGLPDLSSLIRSEYRNKRGSAEYRLTLFYFPNGSIRQEANLLQLTCHFRNAINNFTILQQSLQDETSVGIHPVNCMEVIDHVAFGIEADLPGQPHRIKIFSVQVIGKQRRIRRLELVDTFLNGNESIAGKQGMNG